MKLKIDWKALGKALWNAVKPVLLGAIGGGVIALTDGCSSLTPSSKTQSMGVYAIGVPGIAIITKSTQNEDASGGDNNAPTQVNPVTTTMSTGKRKRRERRFPEEGSLRGSDTLVASRNGRDARCPSL